MQSVVSVGDLKPFGLRFNSAFVDNEQRDPPRVQKNRKQGNETAEKKQPTPRTGGRKTTNTMMTQASSDNTAPAARSARFPASHEDRAHEHSAVPGASQHRAHIREFSVPIPCDLRQHPSCTAVPLSFFPHCPCLLSLFQLIHSPWL